MKQIPNFTIIKGTLFKHDPDKKRRKVWIRFSEEKSSESFVRTFWLKEGIFVQDSEQWYYKEKVFENNTHVPRILVGFVYTPISTKDLEEMKSTNASESLVKKDQKISQLNEETIPVCIVFEKGYDYKKNQTHP